jgi:hypothetical protein
VSGDDGWRSSLRFRASYHVCQAWPVRAHRLKIYQSHANLSQAPTFNQHNDIS